MRVLTTKIRQKNGRFMREQESWENPRVCVALPLPPSPLGGDAEGGHVPLDREHRCHAAESAPLSPHLRVAALPGNGVGGGPPGCPPAPLPAGGGCPLRHAHAGTGPGGRGASLQQRIQRRHHPGCRGEPAPAWSSSAATPSWWRRKLASPTHPAAGRRG
jgi:hypothetical protein